MRSREAVADEWTSKKKAKGEEQYRGDTSFLLEALLGIRDQNERMISLLERQPRLVFIPTTANIHDIISEIKQELDRDA